MPAITPHLRLNAQGTQVQTVQANLAKVGLTVPATESTASVLGAGTSTAVKQFQIANKLPVTGTVDVATQSALTNAATAAAANQSTVSGQMLMDYGAPANAITARLYSIGFAAAATKLAETKTDANGMYSLAYAAPTTAINIEVRVVNPQNTEVTVSSVIYNVRPKEVLNLVVPASVQPLTDEFDRLSADLQTAIGGVANLTKAQETPAQQDLTLLNRTTGWDARLLAIATTAAQQAATTGLGTDVLYALYRCGLPTDPQALALVPSATIGAALQKASQAGIVSMTAAQITASQTTFTTYAAKANLAIKVPGSLSAVSDLLGTTFTDPNLQTSFMNLVFDPTVQGADLWNKAASAGVPAATIDTLKLQGKLSLLTFNNAKLASQLQTQVGSLANLSQLADQDYHLDTTWTTLLNTLSGNNAQTLQTLIPPLYGGTAPAEAYAADLARKVRVSFPTRVIARMVENNSLPLPVAAPAPSTSAASTAPAGTTASPAPPTVAQGVTTFLRSADAVGFKLGVTPLNAFLKNPPKGVTVPTDSSTVKWIKNLHRLYQITPSNESLVAAVKLGFSSARDVAALSEDKFLSTYGSSFPTDEAKLVYRKARQVNSGMVHVFSTAKLLDTLPPMYVLNPSPKAVQSAKNAIIQQYPTMATLFGAQDYCECDDCRSILSPAAYLVSLFQFIDDGPIWQAFLTNWQAMYNQTYPTPSQTPFSVLTTRRPDLQYLNLSCENTNTALPYIDVVNEILEYYAVNGNLSQLNYDTGSAASANLIAEPQNVLQAAYSILSNQNSKTPAVYPLGLPFDLWIETVRSFLGYFNIKLARVLEVFRPADNLELFTDANNYSYYRASIFAEALGIAPCEYALFTGTSVLQNWYEFYGYPAATASNTAGAALGGSAKTLANNLNVSYQDLANIVDTGFLNPKLAPLIGPLLANGLSLNDVFAYTKQPGFTSNATIPAPLQQWLNSLLGSGYSNTVLILQAPSANTCDFQDTKFQYAGGTTADQLSFLKLNFFVRLWNKLGWTIDEVDQALQVFLLPFIPASTDATFGADFSAAMKTALVYLSHLEELFTKLQAGPYGRIGILPLWGNIPTTGSNSLYAQIFLTPAVVNSDAVFNDPAGQYLCYYDPTSKMYLPFQTQNQQAAGFVLLSSHTTALQGALGLTANDITSILNDNNLPLTTTPLTMANVSLLYRYAFLSQALQLSISDFIALKQMSGLNPFAPLKAPLAVLADDAVWNQTLKFVEIAAKVQASGFTISQLQYLLSQYDPTAQYSPDPDAQMQQLMATATAIQAIQTQNAVPSDQTAFTDDLIRQKMAQVFPASTAQTFMGMWSGTVQYTATAPAGAAIPSTILPQEPQIQLGYDPVAQAQSLVYQGVLVDAAMTRITGEITALVTAGTLTAAQQNLLQALLTNVQGQAQAFFQKYLQVASGPLPYGFLPASDFDLLFTPPTPPATNTAARQELANKFLPYLQQSLISQYLIRATASSLGASTALTTDFLTNTAVLADPTQPGASLMSALQAAALNGLSVTYYSDPAEQTKLTSGVPAIVASADTSLADTTQNPPVPKATGFNSAHFEGYLVVPSDGLYRFTAVLPSATATVSLQFDFMSSPLIYGLATATGTPVTYTASKDTQFKAGIPYHFTFDVQSLGGGQASLLVQGESLPQGPLSQLTLYPEVAVQRFNQANVLLSNAFQLISGFNLDETEVLYLTANAADFDNLSFSALPTLLKNSFTPNPTLFGQFLRLANYASLRQGPAGGTDGLIELFQQARQTFPASAASPGNQTLANFCQSADALTNRVAGTSLATVNQLWPSGLTNSSTIGTGAQAQVQITLTPLVNDVGFRRLWEALQLVQTLGVPPTLLGYITGIVYPSRAASSATPPTTDPGSLIAAQLENAIKSFYGSQPQTWLTIAQSIFDPLRQKKRDALCAYVLTLPDIQKFGATNTNGLFEYFLVDPGMEPVVQTSRIELAMSSAQTFIQRCLLNLEPLVHPSAIDADQWSWMKRYRVWDANREIFLWPENWLIPEFREDATDLFQAMEGTLLQGNITEDLVETAFNQYLQDLDTRARLDIVTMYNEPPTAQADYNTYHVIGRNHGKPPKYFYRTFANGTWACWIPVTADIEGDHIAAVVWRGRLTVFWLTFAIQGGPKLPATQGTDSNDTTTQTAANMSIADIVAQASAKAPPTTVQIKLNWSEYFQGQWSPRKASDINRFDPITVDSAFDPVSDVYIHLSVDSGTSADTDSPDPVETVFIQLDSASYPTINGAFRLTSKNAEPTFGKGWQYWQQAWSPYNNNPNSTPVDSQNFSPVYYYDASKYVGYDSVSGSPSISTLYVNLPAGWVNNADGSSTQLSAVNETILQDVSSFTILMCDNMAPIAGTWRRDMPINIRGLNNFYFQAGALTSPFFYQDTSDVGNSKELAFFVQPSFVQQFIPNWSGWILSHPLRAYGNSGALLSGVKVQSQVPNFGAVSLPDRESLYAIQTSTDWVTKPATLLPFQSGLVTDKGSTVLAANVTNNLKSALIK